MCPFPLPHPFTLPSSFFSAQNCPPRHSTTPYEYMGPEAGKLGDRVVEAFKRFRLNCPSFSCKWETDSFYSWGTEAQREQAVCSRQLVAKCLNHDLNMSSLTPESILCLYALLPNSSLVKLNSVLLLLVLWETEMLKTNTHADYTSFKFMPWHSPESLLYFLSQFIY